MRHDIPYSRHLVHNFLTQCALAFRVAVSFIDPRSVTPCKEDGIDSVKVLVPKSFLSVLRSGGQHELGEGDDPMNRWAMATD